MEELSAIGNIKRKDHIILIDDLRIINKSNPWGEKSYGDIDFLEQIKKKMVSEGISKFINPKRKWCIIKISPSATNFDIDNYYNMGFRQFHCCNTIPVTNGGLSGPALIPYTSEKIIYLKSKYNDVSVIAGGGIRYINDIYHYKSIGANHFSVSTLLFNPLLFASFMYDFINSKK